MSELDIILPAMVIAAQIFFIILNIGVLLAYFQRNRLDRCNDDFRLHLTQAILYGVPGMLATPGIFVGTERFRFGIKFWRGEIPMEENRWLEPYKDAMERREHWASMKRPSKKNVPDGRCVDLWED